MAKKPKGFTSEKQRRAVMALLTEMHLGLSKGKIPKGWKKIAKGADRTALRKGNIVAKIEDFGLPGLTGEEQNKQEIKVLRKYGGKEFKIKYRNSPMGKVKVRRVKFPTLLAHGKIKSGKQRGSSYLMMQHIGGSHSKMPSRLKRSVVNRFGVGDLHKGNVKRKGDTYWIIDSGFDNFGESGWSYDVSPKKKKSKSKTTSAYKPQRYTKSKRRRKSSTMNTAAAWALRRKKARLKK